MQYPKPALGIKQAFSSQIAKSTYYLRVPKIEGKESLDLTSQLYSQVLKS